MHCERARDRLFEHLDAAGRPADAELDAHLNDCADCRALRDGLQDLEAQARVWHELSPPPWNPAPSTGNPGASAPSGAIWRTLVLQWFPPLASAAALLLAAGVYLQSGPAGAGTTAMPASAAAEAAGAPLEHLLATSRQERQAEMAALTTLLKAEMDRRSLETEQSLKYIISHQIQSQRQLEAIRGRLPPDGQAATAEQL